MQRSLFALTFFFIGFLEARAELSCFQIFAENPKLTAFAFFQPFKIGPLVQRVDYRDNFNPQSLDPTLDKLVFSRNDIQLLQELELPMHRMRSEDRWVETDYGYALMTVNELRDWTLLARIIRDPEASKRFIENIARHDDVYPSGITRESADWIRWSVFVNELAVQRVVNRLNPREDDLANYQKFKIYLNDEYRKFVRQNEKLMFTVGIERRAPILSLGTFNFTFLRP